MKEEPPTPEFPNGRVWVEVAVSVYDHRTEGIYLGTYGVRPKQTVEHCMTFLKGPMSSAVGVIGGWIPKLSEAEMWELQTPACDKKHKRNPFI